MNEYLIIFARHESQSDEKFKLGKVRERDTLKKILATMFSHIVPAHFQIPVTLPIPDPEFFQISIPFRIFDVIFQHNNSRKAINNTA